MEQAYRERGLAGLPEGLLLVDFFDRGGDSFEPVPPHHGQVLDV